MNRYNILYFLLKLNVYSYSGSINILMCINSVVQSQRINMLMFIFPFFLGNSLVTCFKSSFDIH